MKNSCIWLIFIFLCSSCSVQKRIGKVANHTMLQTLPFIDAHTGITVYDPATDKYIYDYQGEKYFTPASNTKLLTGYVAMKYLGDSLPGINYSILNDSTVVIAGNGDPTLLHPDFPHQRVIDFLKTFKNIEYIPSGFNDYIGNGWSWDDYIYDYAAPRSSLPLYGNVVRMKLEGNSVVTTPSYFEKYLTNNRSLTKGFSVARPWDENKFTISAGERREMDVPYVPNNQIIIDLLADTLHAKVSLHSTNTLPENNIQSLPLDTMLAIMLHRSDNFFAEQCLLMVSRKLMGEMSDQKIVSHLLETDYAAMPQKPVWRDGSGLSSYNLVSPHDFVFVLNKMKNEFGMDRMKVLLPTGGTGTLATLYKQDSGYIFAKTGTISGVIALSGYLITKKDKLFLFSVLVNNHRSKPQDIRKGIEKFLTTIREKY